MYNVTLFYLGILLHIITFAMYFIGNAYTFYKII